ncbi:DNA polymerase III subunit gamma and tau [Micromonospora endolithica]|uniref:DNA polymerase III subunit gamma/tau n=1 Tax=Micromonospora endolithica TaxID=230091 RepID=A0A3A9Z3G0_9ACTN|nr:DNA polymerase III subunit gamma and tau [Micromonospora endolithica]RKN42798.1 DNA polymerase III subunit gamma and tau [Micromonospora endolithica]TWJ25347.1 DNA polymerase-3 subunit gamma/tau [Micromonospora endolithica]
MALALYRKYRPRTFAEVIGQEHVTEPLSQALRSGRLNHAYLFSGPRGCGKTTSARIMARSLNCEQGPTPEPCGQCGSCRSLATDGAGSIDVIEIDAASHGGVDDARELRERAFFAPANSRFKIYIIDEAHMVSTQGFNALLKLVEEPPEYVKFIFATTEPEKVLGTIRSRTHHYPFRLFPPKVVRPYLEQLTQAEGVAVEPAVFPLVVRAGGGSMRDSLSVLDQLIAGAGAEGVSYARAVALLGVTDSALIDEMCDALAAGDGAAAYAAVDRVAEAGHDMRRFASDLLERLRDLIVLQQVPEAAAKGLIDGPADQIERMAAQAQRLGPGTLSRCADIVHDGLVEMRGTTAPRLLLELICARMLLPGADDSTGGLLQRLERMERRLTLAGTDAPADQPPAVRAQPPAPPAAAAAIPAGTAGMPAATGADVGATPSTEDSTADAAAATSSTPVAPRIDRAPTPAGPTSTGSSSPPGPGGSGPVGGSGPAGSAPAGSAPAGVPAGGAARRPVPPSAVMPDPATPAPPRPGAGAPGALDAVAVRRAWPEVVGKVNRSHKKIAALMRDAVVRDLDGDTLVLTVKSSVLAKMLSDHAAVLTDALYEELGGRWQIRCEVAGERGGVSLGGSSRAQARPNALPTDAGPAAPAAPAVPGPAPTSAPPASANSSSNPTSAPPASANSSSNPTSAPPASANSSSNPTSAAPGRPNAAVGPAGAPNASSGTAPGSAAGPVGVPHAAAGPAGAPNVATGPGVPDGRSGERGGDTSGADGAGGRGGAAGQSGGKPVPADDEDDWPEAARPGGNASAAEATDDEDWPEAARPGGAAVADLDTAPGGAGSAASTNGGGTGPSGGDPNGGGRRAANGGGPGATGAGSARSTGRPDARAGNPTPAARQPASAGGAPVSSAIAAARAAAAGRGPRTASATRPVADAEWAGEPPYDPDFDGPLRGGRPGGSAPAAVPAYEGFDPGDEPSDEVIDEKTARESSEAQAVRLLRETLGAEKINEVDAR